MAVGRHVCAGEFRLSPFFSSGAEAVSDIESNESWQATRYRRRLLLPEACMAGMVERSRIFELAGPLPRLHRQKKVETVARSKIRR
jgi:hypothetical protein